MIVIGDIQSPSDFLIEGSRFLSIRDQIATGFSFAGLCPSRSYARKNVGYLVAAAGGAKIIVETDDDNFPRPAFFGPRFRSASANVAINEGWLNVYRHFTDSNIWPRGLPFDHVGDAVRSFDDLSRRREARLRHCGSGRAFPPRRISRRRLPDFPFAPCVFLGIW